MTSYPSVIDILGDIARSASQGCVITVPDFKGGFVSRPCPPVRFVFGNGMYIKEHLDDLASITGGEDLKFPLIALWCPFTEQRDNPDYASKAKVNLLIACSSTREWSNEERKTRSFENILRPLYRSFMGLLSEDPRLEIRYDGVIPHQYSENYSYGKYGAVTASGEKVSEPLDAINISNLEITVKIPTCR